MVNRASEQWFHTSAPAMAQDTAECNVCVAFRNIDNWLSASARETGLSKLRFLNPSTWSAPIVIASGCCLDTFSALSLASCSDIFRGESFTRELFATASSSSESSTENLIPAALRIFPRILLVEARIIFNEISCRKLWSTNRWIVENSADGEMVNFRLIL